MILYLHGFRSSPQSFKARLLGERMAQLGRADEYLCPQLPVSPRAAMDLALGLTRNFDPAQLTVFGSSLGGYYATHLAEQLGCRAVMLNPAMRAFEKLAGYVGPQTMYHDAGESFEFKREYLDELRAQYVPAITRPERYFLVAATGDELLDWREMISNFPGARHKVIEGSDHGLSDFAGYMDETLAFAGVTGPR
jgi:predicted esterase YcpF (UPF0227 family)